jgi:hypothetical protein
MLEAVALVIAATPATSWEQLPHINTSKALLSAAVKFGVTDFRVQSLVFGHLLVSVEIDRLEALAPRLGFGELKQSSS